MGRSWSLTGGGEANGKKSLRPFGLVVAVVLLCFLSLTYFQTAWWFGWSGKTKCKPNNDFHLVPTKMADDYRELGAEPLPGLAVVIIAGSDDPSNTFYQFWAYLSVRTLRMMAGFKGPVYVLTNDAAFHKSIKTDATIIDVAGKYPDAVQSLPNNGLRAKYFKTRILDLIPKTHAYVLYTDADMMFRSPLTSFFYNYIVQLNRYDFMILNNPYSFTNKGFPNSYNSALFAFRTPLLNGTGGQLLVDWEQKLHEYKNKSPKDQTALYFAITDNNWTDKIFVLDYNKLIFYPKAYDFNVTKSNDLLSDSDTPFFHIALSAWRKYEIETVITFLSTSLDLPESLLREQLLKDN